MLTEALFRMPSICAGVLMHACGGIGKPCRCRASRRSSKPRWHRLYFLPLPHQQGALRSGIFKKSPSFGSRGGIVAYSCSACARRRAGMRGQRIRVRRSHTARRYRECAGWSFARPRRHWRAALTSGKCETARLGGRAAVRSNSRGNSRNVRQGNGLLEM